TRNAVETLEIPAGITAFRTNGFASVGDGGAALYKRVGSNPNVGPALQTNGSFETDTDWSKTGIATIGSGAANFTGTGAGEIRQNVNAQLASFVRVEYKIRAFGSGSGGVRPNLMVNGVYTPGVV